MMHRIQRVTVLGAGVLGAQIAHQAAYSGFEVTTWDLDNEALTQARKRFQTLAATYRDEVPGAADRGDASGSITLTSDLAEAVAHADLVIEAVPERLDIKQSTWARVGAHAPEHAILASNSSTLLPSAMAASTGRPERFLALHFANQIWLHNTAEVMGTPQTDPEVYASAVAFAREMGMVPIEIHKEQPGYVLNSLLVPFLTAAADLVVRGVAEPRAIDQTWKIGTGSPVGPFEILDIVGLTTPYNIARNDPRQAAWADYLKTNFIDRGRLGRDTGQGFYTYDSNQEK
ncbi:3-hydroxyacyl-CoA dehydrogenase [Naumannella sp. ID2617S]|nr:3-hydroxyacyl-CoA dehydrogenase [Naumannella sp. ID2617S]